MAKAKFSSAKKLREQIDAYMGVCQNEGIFPDLAGMRLYLDISEKEMLKYCEDETFESVFRYARDCRESWLVRRMTMDNKVTQGCLIALRQPCNGGYVDKPRENTDKKLVIEFRHNLGPEDFK